MSEVTVVAMFKLKPGHEAEAEEILREVITATHGEEGCLNYALHRALDDPTRFVIVERWRSRQDLDEHLQMPHLAPIAGAAANLEEPPQVYVLESRPVGDPVKGVLGGVAARASSSSSSTEPSR